MGCILGKWLRETWTPSNCSMSGGKRKKNKKENLRKVKEEGKNKKYCVNI
jgi:hypothetical protein